jgi:hypothetical protein
MIQSLKETEQELIKNSEVRFPSVFRKSPEVSTFPCTSQQCGRVGMASLSQVKQILGYRRGLVPRKLGDNRCLHITQGSGAPQVSFVSYSVVILTCDLPSYLPPATHLEPGPIPSSLPQLTLFFRLSHFLCIYSAPPHLQPP